MPEFILNTPAHRKPLYDSLDDFAKGYIEAMFFTNGDTGDDNENLLNDLGIERLTKSAILAIRDRCERFKAHAGSVVVNLDEFDSEQLAQAGRDFWFTQQGHGCGFWSRDEDTYGSAEIRDRLDAAAKRFGNQYVEVSRGWVYHI